MIRTDQRIRRHLRRFFALVGLGALVLAPSAAGVPGDPTPPEITVATFGTLGANGWYVSNVTLVWTVAEPEGPPLSTSGCDAMTLTADTIGTTFTCSATSDGGTTIKSKTIMLDKTAPAVTAINVRAPDSNGWYNRPLTFALQGTDATSGIDSCPAATYAGPDGAGASVSGSCRDRAGNTTVRVFALAYDATAPQVSGASPARAPDANGWFNHPLTISFRGTDAASGVDRCTEAVYSGPDNADAAVTGSCIDRAGNRGGSSEFALKYDSTAPVLTDLSVKAGDRTVLLRWRASTDTRLIEVVRSSGHRPGETTVYRGTGQSYADKGLTNRVKYHYEVSAYDDARNAARRSVFALPRAALYGPPPNAKIASPPLLAWTRVANAKYYNVQVWRRGRKIFSAWPSRSSLRLKRSWTYEGRRYRMTPGRYRWYVWPAFGGRGARTFGRLLGGSSFIVTNRKG